jgi:hypothetical protein
MADATLEPRLIAETINLLHKRIQTRFPASGLAAVAEKLCRVTERAGATSNWIARPIWPLRILVYSLTAMIILGLGLTLWTLPLPQGGLELAQFIQVLESAINDVVLIVAAVFFLGSIETRIKRERALRSIHELRAIAHVIDMHQLTKDPEWVLDRGTESAVLPPRSMTAFQLSRYLDYCTEMLAITGKIAALYIQRFEDSVALQAVNEVEDLTSGLSSKIGQKLMILYTVHGRSESAPTSSAGSQD